MNRIAQMVLVASFATGCVSVKQIGSVNMMATRNIDPTLKYVAISTYSGGSKDELTSSKATNLEDAITNTVKHVPGGEFLMNVKVYKVDEKYYAVEGDVWGSGDLMFRGFRVGDKVTYKNPAIFTTTKYLTGTVSALKSDEVCLIAPDADPGHLVEIKYDDVSKAGPGAVAPPAAK